MSVRLKPYLFIAGLSTASVLGYLIISYSFFNIGFPLDDAWIHQTFARNLLFYGEWAFQPGTPSAGSTAPLWSAMLGLGYLFGLAPYGWTYLFGVLFLFAIAVVGFHAFNLLCPSLPKYAIWVGVFLVFEWHLVWAATSGMETLAFAFLVLLTLTFLTRGRVNWLTIGLLIGLSIWLRPDGITLAGPALLFALLTNGSWKERLLAIWKLVLGVLSLIIPYLVFNHSISGHWWPNTFFAKQAEYAMHRQIPFINRLFEQVSLPLIGAGVLLLPGLALFIVHEFRRRTWFPLIGIIWLVGYLVLYAWRLPVTYQHGRYIIPAMPVYFLYSLTGLFLVLIPSSPALWKRVLSRTYLISLGLVTFCFYFIGAKAYARDVAIIESEMIATARWLANNTEPDALVAAHDIGALGYFANRRLLDLAGLVSPEVIPFIRDELQLKAFLDENEANYLVTFPGWYPYLVNYGELIFCTMGHFSPEMGGENMSIYRWIPP